MLGVVSVTVRYWWALGSLVFGGWAYRDIDKAFGNDKWAKVQIYSLSLIFRMWREPHYRSSTFQEDLINNLRNVAVPGTGVPLSAFCRSYWVCLAFVFFANPLICFLGAVNKCRRKSNHRPGAGAGDSLRGYYEQHLLHPDDWFSFWQLNCRLTSYESMISRSDGFAFENKWKFLLDGRDAGVPVSPFMEVEDLVCKHINIEGGMGIQFYKNALHGGEWILQERMKNADWISELLPPNAPLSTMRVITASEWALSRNAPATSIFKDAAVPCSDLGEAASKYIYPCTAVLRLGRAGASTDHSSVLFDIDMGTGEIRKGLSNAHWYRLGLQNITSCPWLPSVQTHTRHPDAPYPEVLGRKVPDIHMAIDICVQSHFKLMPDVPMVGWDVTFTPKGLFLLEVNLSCNFFKGTFNIERYISLVERYWQRLDALDPHAKKRV